MPLYFVSKHYKKSKKIVKQKIKKKNQINSKIIPRKIPKNNFKEFQKIIPKNSKEVPRVPGLEIKKFQAQQINS